MFKLRNALPHNPLRDALATAFANPVAQPSFLRTVKIDQDLPIVVCETQRDPYFNGHEIDSWFFKSAVRAMRSVEKVGLPSYRGVPLSRLEAVAEAGIDVRPTDSVIWVADAMEKALEYGGNQSKAVLLLDHKRMARSNRLLPPDAPPARVAEVEKAYGSPTILPNGSRFYSRLPVGDPSRGKSNEDAYGWYIPESPFAALVGVVIFLVQS
jgi:hypothetical protein